MPDFGAPAKSIMGLVPSLRDTGKRLVDAGELQQFLNYMYSAQTVGAAGTTAATAAPLTAGVNAVETATAVSAIGLRLPPALPGGFVTVINDTTVALTVFANGTDQIYPNGSATPGASAALASGQSIEFVSHKVGFWKAFASA